jgi:hypothetical protein
MRAKTDHKAGALTRIERINAIYKQKESKIMHGSKQQQAKCATLWLGKTRTGQTAQLADLQQRRRAGTPPLGNRISSINKNQITSGRPATSADAHTVRRECLHE